MVKKYTFMRVDKDAYENLKRRVTEINEKDLRNTGKKLTKIDMTRYLFKNKVWIPDNVIWNLAQKKKKGRLC